MHFSQDSPSGQLSQLSKQDLQLYSEPIDRNYPGGQFHSQVPEFKLASGS